MRVIKPELIAACMKKYRRGGGIYVTALTMVLVIMEMSHILKSRCYFEGVNFPVCILVNGVKTGNESFREKLCRSVNVTIRLG